MKMQKRQFTQSSVELSNQTCHQRCNLVINFRYTSLVIPQEVLHKTSIVDNGIFFGMLQCIWIILEVLEVLENIRNFCRFTFPAILGKIYHKRMEEDLCKRWAELWLPKRPGHMFLFPQNHAISVFNQSHNLRNYYFASTSYHVPW